MTVSTTVSNLKTALYRKPIGEIERLLRWGPKAYFLIDEWAEEMERYALTKLEPLSNKKEVFDIWFMTGEKHWYQTAFCAHSFSKTSEYGIRPIIIDDGSLNKNINERISELFPGAIIKSKEECDEVVERNLPVYKFPNIRKWRGAQILFRKLTDLHCDSEEWRIFFDSDMLFFHNPKEIIDYLKSPSGCLYQTDCWESYGYTRELTERLTGTVLPKEINIGIFSMHGSQIDWEKVEWWLQELEAAESRKYNITQCVCAMIMADKPLVQLDKERYKVLPSKAEVIKPSVPLHHYVSDSKPWYFRYGWKNALDVLKR